MDWKHDKQKINIVVLLLIMKNVKLLQLQLILRILNNREYHFPVCLHFYLTMF